MPRSHAARLFAWDWSFTTVSLPSQKLYKNRRHTEEQNVLDKSQARIEDVLLLSLGNNL